VTTRPAGVVVGDAVSRFGREAGNFYERVEELVVLRRYGLAG